MKNKDIDNLTEAGWRGEISEEFKKQVSEYTARRDIYGRQTHSRVDLEFKTTAPRDHMPVSLDLQRSWYLATTSGRVSAADGNYLMPKG